VTGLAFSADGATLVSASLDRTLRWWHMDSGDAQAVENVGAPVRALALAPGQGRLALALEGGAVAFISAEPALTQPASIAIGPGQSRVQPSSFSVRGLSWSHDGALLALACDDGSVRLWDARGVEQAALASHSNWTRAVAFAPCDALLASGGDDYSVRLWRLSDGALLHTCKGHSGNVTTVAFVDNDTLASASLDRTVRLWRVSDGAPIATLEGHVGSVERVAALPATGQIASASSDGTIRIWGV
ncbi:MAG: WD40 repeat domain-containing protein, partial [Chloroflexales bacterium]|nr:WD40 repeat domain-containing protein [Chloroflexales bacterium]